LTQICRSVVELIEAKQNAILIVQLPPRHGKSQFISRSLPAWYCGRYPDNRVILASYSDSLARMFSRHSRDLLDEYAWAFGIKGIRHDVSSVSDWQIDGHDGGMVSAGVGGGLTGKGAHLLIIDDPLKNAEEAISDKIRDKQWEWFTSTAWTRLEPGGVCIVVQTRWHEDDLAGRILKNAHSLKCPVYLLSLPALAEGGDLLGREPGEPLWPQRYDRQTLLQREAVLGAYWWGALFQQRPGQYGKNEWPAEYFLDIWCDSMPTQFDLSGIYIDPSKGKNAKKGDYSAIVFGGVHNGTLYVDASLARRPVSQIVVDAIALRQQYLPQCFGMEANGFQELLAPEFTRYVDENQFEAFDVSLDVNTVAKELRIARIGPYLKRDKIKFLRSSCGMLVKQLKDFPNGDHDDGPDALEGLIRLLLHRGAIDSQIDNLQTEVLKV
jgi:predicted phage terminase large subunit-like protein